MCTISKDICINKENKICVPNRESISGHRCKRTYMTTECEMFVNCSKNFIDIEKKKQTNMTVNTKGVIDVKEQVLLTN